MIRRKGIRRKAIRVGPDLYRQIHASISRKPQLIEATIVCDGEPVRSLVVEVQRTRRKTVRIRRCDGGSIVLDVGESLRVPLTPDSFFVADAVVK